MERVPIGTKVKRLGIPRLSVGEGATCRAILLEQDPQMKHIAYDDARKVRVEVDQDMCIKYGLRPSPTFFYLVAKLNTDLNGDVIGDKFTVEYLQLSENLNNELAAQIAEQGVPKSLHLTKVKKQADGKDFSYIKVVPSAQGFEDNKSLWDKINKLRANKEFIDTCWKFIDADTSKTKEQYIALLNAASQQANGQRQIAAQSQQQRALPPTQGSVMPQVPDGFAAQNDFDATGGEFSDENF